MTSYGGEPQSLHDRVTELEQERDRLREALAECYVDLGALLNATTWELALGVRNKLRKTHDLAEAALAQSADATSS